jgi:hypothetical protein
MCTATCDAFAVASFVRHVLDSAAAHSWKMGSENTSITEVVWASTGNKAGWSLLRLNGTAHLQQQR